MAEAKRKPTEENQSNLGLEGFDQFFSNEEETITTTADPTATKHGGPVLDSFMSAQLEKLLERFSDLISLSVDQRVESAKMATQLIENQRQLIATQQILIKLMERSIELTRHIAAIEEKLPAVFELPRIVNSLKDKIVQMEGYEQ